MLQVEARSAACEASDGEEPARILSQRAIEAIQNELGGSDEGNESPNSPRHRQNRLSSKRAQGEGELKKLKAMQPRSAEATASATISTCCSASWGKK